MLNLWSANGEKTEKKVIEMDNVFVVVPNTPQGHPTMNPTNSNQILFLDSWKDENNFVYDTIENKYIKYVPQYENAKHKTLYSRGLYGESFCSISDKNNKLGSFFSFWDFAKQDKSMCAGVYYRIFNATEHRWESADSDQIILQGRGYPGSFGKCIRYGKWILTFGFIHTSKGLNINVYEINNINQRLTEVKTIDFKHFSKDSNQPLRLNVFSKIVLLPKYIYRSILVDEDIYGSCDNSETNRCHNYRETGNIAVFLLSNRKEFFRSFVALKINFTNIHGKNSIQIFDDCPFFNKNIETVLGKIFNKDDRYIEYSMNILYQRYLILSGGFRQRHIKNGSRLHFETYIMQNMFYFDLLQQEWKVCKTKLPYPMAKHVVFFVDNQDKHKNKHKQLKDPTVDCTDQQELKSRLNTLEMHVIGSTVTKNEAPNLGLYKYERFHFHGDMSKVHLLDCV